jgi:tRNA(Ile)-lysidine synthase
LTNLLDRIRHDAARHALWTPDTRVVAALSGGSDSMAQLRLLLDLAAAGELILAGAAHLNHRLRPTATRDEAACRAACDRLGVPLVAEAEDVAALAAEWRCSLEVAARRCRYAFFERAVQTLGAARIAVAHTLDDQAETVLLRLLRGAGTHGLRGMPARRGLVVRSLLGCTRAELRADLTARGETWVEDETNADVAQLRNRVRHELLPLISTRFQPAILHVLARTAEVAAAEDALLDARAAEVLSAGLSTTAEGASLARGVVNAVPLAIRRRVVRLALAAAGASRSPDLADVDRVLAIAGGGGPKAGEAAGLRVERFSADAVLLSRGRPPSRPLPERPLPVPGEAALPELGRGCRLVADRPIRTRRTSRGTKTRAVLRTDVPAPFTVRSRRPGDWMRPIGMQGRKKLQDLLVDRKVPQSARDRVPVIVDATGRVVWVVGHALDAGAAAESGANDVIVLTFDQPGEPGSEGS